VWGVWAVVARRRPDVAAAPLQDAVGTATSAVQAEEYTASTANLLRQRTARTRGPSAHHSDHPAVIQTTHIPTTILEQIVEITAVSSHHRIT